LYNMFLGSVQQTKIFTAYEKKVEPVDF
jgi:hypothetical protein